MIGQHREYPVELVADSPDNPVHPLDRLHLLLNTPEVAGLVRSLDVDVNKVKAFDRLERVPCLGIVIGIEITGCAGDADNLHTGTAGDPVEELR